MLYYSLKYTKNMSTSKAEQVDPIFKEIEAYHTRRHRPLRTQLPRAQPATEPERRVMIKQGNQWIVYYERDVPKKFKGEKQYLNDAS